jgi:hypothetical protein
MCATKTMNLVEELGYTERGFKFVLNFVRGCGSVF